MTTYGGDTVTSVVASGTRNEQQFAVEPALFPVATHYALSCFDNVDVRHYWTDAVPTMVNAPAGFTYVSATLAVESKF